VPGLAINVLFFCSLLLVLNGSERTALVGCSSLAHIGPEKVELPFFEGVLAHVLFPQQLLFHSASR